MAMDVEQAFYGIMLELGQMKSIETSNGILAEKYFYNLTRQVTGMADVILAEVYNYIKALKGDIIQVMVNYMGGIKKELTEIDDRLRFIDNSLDVIDEKISELKTLFETFHEKVNTLMRTLE